MGLDVWLLADLWVSMRGGVCDLDDKHEDEVILAQQHTLFRSTTVHYRSLVGAVCLTRQN